MVPLAAYRFCCVALGKIRDFCLSRSPIVKGRVWTENTLLIATIYTGLLQVTLNQGSCLYLSTPIVKQMEINHGNFKSA